MRLKITLGSDLYLKVDTKLVLCSDFIFFGNVSTQTIEFSGFNMLFFPPPQTVKTEALKTKVTTRAEKAEQTKQKDVIPVKPEPEVQAPPEPASPTPMETSGCEPADLCQAFSDVILHTAIRDVDADDYDNPMLCSEYVKDIYKYLRQLEASNLK